MHENEYAYAVARVRANEVNLLSPAETEQLITAESYDAALRLLGDKGWHTDGVGHDYAPMLEEHMSEAWQLLEESAPDASLLDALVINNDFFNLKAALKAKFSDLDPADYVVRPSVWNPEEIIGCVVQNELDSLPECMRECAKAAYDAIVKLESGRLADTMIDTAALKTRKQFAEKSGSGLLMKEVELSSAAANIKTALRCASTGRTADYIKNALCPCESFSSDELIQAAFEGVDAVAELLANTEFGSLADSLKEGLTAFEKKCDELSAQQMTEAKYTAFGPDPLAAYYSAVETETKNVRVILSAKLNGFSADTIRARVREVYA